MKRREFSKLISAGCLGAGFAGSSFESFARHRSMLDSPDLPNQIREYDQSHRQRYNMSGFAAPKIEIVRVGIVGLGQRGPVHARLMRQLENVEIRALCDLVPEKAHNLKKQLEEYGHTPDLYYGHSEAWKKMCERNDLDLVILATPWYMHAQQGVFAMEHNKHVASEVPAAATLDECWQLVKTAEQTRKHFMMMDNSSYRSFQLLTLNMSRKGFFGQVVHGDCAYNTSKMRNNFSKNMYWDMWWLRQYAKRRGNIYPTHGLGPVCQIMDINRGDRLDYLVSMESDDFMMREKAQELASEDPFFKPFSEKEYRGNMNVTTIRTKKGKTIMLQHDATSPSPHNVIHGIYGTRGAALYDPQPPRISAGNHKWVSQEEFNSLKKKYTPEIILRMGELAKGSGHGGSDLLITWRLVDCLQNGLPLDKDVYDAASLSSIVPLSEWSVLNRSNSINIPDFTTGKWKTNSQNMDVNLNRGGNTGLKL